MSQEADAKLFQVVGSDRDEHLAEQAFPPWPDVRGLQEVFRPARSYQFSLAGWHENNEPDY